MIYSMSPDPVGASYQESLAMAEALGAKVKECYFNSIIGCATMTVGIPQDLIFYIEGVAIDRHGIPFEHGWINIDGKIIDPTWVLIQDQGKLEQVVYIPAISYSMDDVRSAFRTADQSGITLRLPLFMHTPGTRKVNHSNEHMGRAMEAAYRHAFGSDAADWINRMLERGIVAPIS